MQKHIVNEFIMRKRKEDFQELLQGLTKAERKICTTQIKKFPSVYRGQLLHLFKELCKLGTDEKKLKKQLLKQSPGWAYARYKNMLSNLVNECLVSERHLSSVENRLRYMLEQEKVLYAKSLFVQCSRLLNQCRELAAHYEYHLIELEVLGRKGALLNELFNDNFRKDLKNIADRRLELVEIIENEFKYRNLCQLIFLLKRKYNVSRTPELQKELLKLHQSPLLTNPQHALNFRSKRFFNNGNAMIYEMTGDFEKSLDFVLKNQKLWQQSPYQQIEKPAAYRAALFHLCNTYLRLRNYKECVKVLHEARKIHVQNEKENSRWFRMIKPTEMLLCLNTGDFTTMPTLLDEAEKGLNKFILPDSFALNLIHNAAVCSFFMENHSLALRWLRKINQYNKSGERQDIRDFAQMLTLIIWYSAGKTDLVENYLRAAKRFYKRNNFLYPFEQLFMTYLPKLLKQTNKKENRQIAAELLGEVNQLMKTGNQPLGTGEIVHWLESVSTGKSMIQLLKDKNN